MRVIESLLTALAGGTALEPQVLRLRLRARLDQLVALGATALAVVLAVAYQVLCHLPRSWRESLLGDEPSGE